MMILPFIFALAQSQWKPPYQPIDPAINPTAYATRLKGESAGIFLDKDVLTLVSKGKSNSLVMSDWFEAPMKRMEEVNLWISQTRMSDWNQAFFSYGIRGKNAVEQHRFRGPKAPPFPIEAKILKGSVVPCKFNSKLLGEERQINVYLPPNSGDNLPVVVMADGESCKEFARVAEPLILSKQVAPFAILGIVSGGYRGAADKYEFDKDFRAKEYLKVFDPDRFALHLAFVCDEMLPWAREKFHLSSLRQDTAVFGYSNGGAFALIAALDRPDVFGSAMPSSVAVIDEKALAEKAKTGVQSRFYFVAGTLELFINRTRFAFQTLLNQNANSALQEYVSGHDIAMWKLGFAKNITKIFPIHQSTAN